jgi:hypothetical protein
MSIARFGGLFSSANEVIMAGGLVLGGSFPAGLRRLTETFNGGLVTGGSFPVTLKRSKETFSGGMVLGGSFIDLSALRVLVTQTVLFSSSGDPAPQVTHTITFTSTVTNAQPYVVAPLNTVIFTSRFHVVTGDLMTGRYRR